MIKNNMVQVGLVIDLPNKELLTPQEQRFMTILVPLVKMLLKQLTKPDRKITSGGFKRNVM